MTDDEELIEQVARALCRVSLGHMSDEVRAQLIVDASWEAWEMPARAILPIIKAERIRGGEMVKAAAISSVATCMMGREILAIRALSVPAIVEAGDGDL